MASQMSNAVFDTVGVDIEAKSPSAPESFLFHSSGRTVKFPGFLKVYTEIDEKEAQEKNDSQKLPPLSEGDALVLDDVQSQSHQTESPAALQRSQPDQDAGKAQHRPAIDLRADSPDNHRTRLRSPGRTSLIPRGSGHVCDRLAERAFQ